MLRFWTLPTVLDAAALDALVLDVSILDVVNTPYEGDFGCFLEVTNVGCCVLDVA